MNIFVFVKQVPDTEARIKIDGSGRNIVTEDVTFTDSPYDEFAVEQAILLGEANDGSTVTAVTIGPERSTSTLRDCLAKGVQEAVHIQSDQYGNNDALSTAGLIASFLKDKEYDFLLFGNKAYGSDYSQVPSMVAALLDIGQINLVTKMDVDGNTVKAERQVEGLTEHVEAKLPVVISAQKGLNSPRTKVLKGIMAAKKKQIPVVDAEELSTGDFAVVKGIEIEKLEYPAAKEGGKKLEVEPEEAVDELVNYLKNELKVV